MENKTFAIKINWFRPEEFVKGNSIEEIFINKISLCKIKINFYNFVIEENKIFIFAKEWGDNFLEYHFYEVKSFNTFIKD